MSEGNSTNSWTILTPEETAAETLRPLAEGAQHHEESTSSTAGHTDSRVEGALSAAERLSVEDQQVSEDKTPALSEDTSTDVPPPSPLDVPGQSEGLSEVPAQSSIDPDSFSDSYTHISPSPDEPPASLLTTETLGAVGLTQEEPTLAQEGTLHPLHGEELGQEREESELSPSVTDFGKQADSPVDSEVGEERIEEKGEEGESEVRRRSLLAALQRIGKREEEEEEEEEEEFQLPQQTEDSGFSLNKCILGAVILLGLGTIFFSGVFMDLDEESDYGAKELRDAEVPVKQEWLKSDVPPPPVEVDSTELLNKLAKGNQQFSVLQAQFQAQKEELKVAKGQAAEGAKERLQREEVERENGRLKKEVASLPVLQKENEKMKRELESLPALQKELETLRVTVAELKLSTANEAAPAPVGSTASPPPGQAGDSMQGTAGTTERQASKPWEGEKVEKKKEWKKEKYGMGEKKEWKEREKFEEKEGVKKGKDEGKMERKEKEWKKGKQEEGKYDQEKGKEGKQLRQNEEKKEWKNEKASRGDEGKLWKDREGKKEWKEKSERKEWKEKGEKKEWKGKGEKKEWKGTGEKKEWKGKGEKKEWKGKDEKKEWKGKGEKKEWKEEKDWKKGKNEKWNDGKEYRGKDEKKERKGGKDHGEWHKGKEEWKGEKEWKKGKDAYKEGGKDWKEKSEKKDWKEKGEKNEWKKDSKNGKDHGKERKDERKQTGRKESKEGEWKREGAKEERSNGDWKKDESKYNKGENRHHHHDNHKEHHWRRPGDRKTPHSHRRPSLEQPDYWVHQREKLQHNPRPPRHCDSVETCARAEGLLPVPLPEFEAVLRDYLAKAEAAGVDASKREELGKLAAEFFRGGVFVHDQMSFQDFVEDVDDILEDMVEGEEDGGGEDGSIEEEMDGFEREVMSKFSVPGAGQREERKKGEWRKESGRGRG